MKNSITHTRVDNSLSGWTVSKNLVYRLYREEGIVLRSKRPRRRKMAVHRQERFMPKQRNEVWSLDFVHDQLSNGEKFRTLMIVDVFSREALAIEVGQRYAERMLLKC